MESHCCSGVGNDVQKCGAGRVGASAGREPLHALIEACLCAAACCDERARKDREGNRFCACVAKNERYVCYACVCALSRALWPAAMKHSTMQGQMSVLGVCVHAQDSN